MKIKYNTPEIIIDELLINNVTNSDEDDNVYDISGNPNFSDFE